MTVYVYYESWFKQWVAYDHDEVDLDPDGSVVGPVVWADTKEEAVAELAELLEEKKKAA